MLRNANFRRALAAIVISGALFFLLASCTSRENDYAHLLAFRQACAKALGERSGSILVMNPHNGVLWAAVNETLGVQKSTRPGSIFKLVTALSLLRNGTVNPAEQFLCEGQIEIDGKTYRCWLREGHGEQNLLQALANSCNVYFYQAVRHLPSEQLTKTARQLLLGECTGINFAQEDCGQLPEWVSPEESISFAIGHARAMAVTPVQMLRLVAALANGGRLYRPFYPTGAEAWRNFRPELQGSLPFGDELRYIKEGMRQSVVYGTSVNASVPEVIAAGKTGTAAEYFGGKTAAWFIGFAPFEKPEIAIVVFLEEGRGALDAAPIGGRVFQDYFALKKNMR
ncbi:hypothetical protein HUU40_11760 [candidate division KSB1 bacterium]|nr:hypothetical protein [candidate division KSB1 bacterium]